MSATSNLEERIIDSTSNNRLTAAARFAYDIVQQNIESVQTPVEEDRVYKKDFAGKMQKAWDGIANIIADSIKTPLCYATFISPFVYSLFALRYSREKRAYLFE